MLQGTFNKVPMDEWTESKVKLSEP